MTIIKKKLKMAAADLTFSRPADKIVKKLNQLRQIYFSKYYEELRKLDHPNIVKIFDFQPSHIPKIIVEDFDNETLYDIIHSLEYNVDGIWTREMPKKKENVWRYVYDTDTSIRTDGTTALGGRNLTPEIRHSWAKQLYSALKYIHERSLPHGCIFPGSIYVSPDFMTIKISGFETVYDVYDPKNRNAGIKYPILYHYIASELLMDDPVVAYNPDAVYNPFSLEGDIYAAGCILFELATRRRAMIPVGCVQIDNSTYPMLKDLGHHGIAMIQMASSSWLQDSIERPTASQVLSFIE